MHGLHPRTACQPQPVFSAPRPAVSARALTKERAAHAGRRGTARLCLDIHNATKRRELQERHRMRRTAPRHNGHPKACPVHLDGALHHGEPHSGAAAKPKQDTNKAPARPKQGPRGTLCKYYALLLSPQPSLSVPYLQLSAIASAQNCSLGTGTITPGV